MRDHELLPEAESEPVSERAVVQLGGLLAVRAEVVDSLDLSQGQADAYTGRVVAYYGQVMEPNLELARQNAWALTHYRPVTRALKPVRQLHENGFPPERLRDGLAPFLHSDQADRWADETVGDADTDGLPLDRPPNRQTKHFLEALTGSPLPGSVTRQPAVELAGRLMDQAVSRPGNLVRLGSVGRQMAHLRAETVLRNPQELKGVNTDRAKLLGAMRHAGVWGDVVRQQVEELAADA